VSGAEVQFVKERVDRSRKPRGLRPAPSMVMSHWVQKEKSSVVGTRQNWGLHFIRTILRSLGHIVLIRYLMFPMLLAVASWAGVGGRVSVQLRMQAMLSFRTQQ